MPVLMAMLCILAHYGKSFFPSQKSPIIDLPSVLVKLINYSNLIDRIKFLNPFNILETKFSHESTFLHLVQSVFIPGDKTSA